VAVDLVKQRPQAHSQPLCSGAPVAVRRLQSIDDGAAFGGLDHRSQGAIAYVLTPDPLSTSWRGGTTWKSSRSKTAFSLSTAARSIAFSNCRTFPGHSCCSSQAIAWSLSDSGRPSRCASRAAKCRDSGAMSSSRSRSGGSSIPRRGCGRTGPHETAPRGPRPRVARRRGEDARVHPARLLIADSPDFTLLQDAQQLCLQSERQLADFVEENRPAVGGLEESSLVHARPGECAAHVPEQLGLEQRLWNRGAVDADERLARARLAR